MVVRIQPYDGIEANQLSGVIDSEEELKKIRDALGNRSKVFRDTESDELRLAVTELLSDGRLLSVQCGVGSWIWLRPLRNVDNVSLPADDDPYVAETFDLPPEDDGADPR